jgi:flavin-dependent dehydrogenase
MISPSSLEGISYSMESAKILAEIINGNSNNINGNCNNISRTYFNKTWGIRIRLLFKMIKKPFMYNKILRMLIMKSGIKTIKIKSG